MFFFCSPFLFFAHGFTKLNFKAPKISLRHHTLVSAGEGVQPDSVGEDEGRSGCQAPGPPGGLQAGQILYRPDRHATHHSRAVPGEEFLVVRQLRGLPQGF